MIYVMSVSYLSIYRTGIDTDVTIERALSLWTRIVLFLRRTVTHAEALSPWKEEGCFQEQLEER